MTVPWADKAEGQIGQMADGADVLRPVKRITCPFTKNIPKNIEKTGCDLPATVLS